MSKKTKNTEVLLSEKESKKLKREEKERKEKIETKKFLTDLKVQRAKKNKPIITKGPFALVPASIYDLPETLYKYKTEKGMKFLQFIIVGEISFLLLEKVEKIEK